MSAVSLTALLPLIIVAALPVLLMLLLAFYRSHRLTAALTLIGLSAACLAIALATTAGLPLKVTALLVIDGYALFFMGLIFAATFAVALLACDYLEKRPGRHDEFYVLLLLAAAGAATLVASNHFASFFIGLEALSVSLYTLIAYLRTTEGGIEAGIKYLVLAAVAAAFLLFGMALIYADLGTMEFSRIGKAAETGGAGSILFMTGLAMIVVGVGFKLALVPFHLWTPDVYEGAPAPVTAFIATVSKGAVFVLLFRYFAPLRATSGAVLLFLGLIAMASMLIGNLLALAQDNVKRILAYSSIAHVGYLMVIFLAGGEFAATAVAYYLVAYFVTMLGAFGIITVLSGAEREADSMTDYVGLAWRRPWLAGAFTAMLLSLTGMPLTAGFVGKFYALAAGVNSRLWLPVIVLVVSSGIGIFYYLRIIVAMYSRPSKEGVPGTPVEPSLAVASLPLTGSLALSGLTLLLVWLGVQPAHLIAVIQAMFAGRF